MTKKQDAIFINMFTPKWARGPHNLARFPSCDPCITPGYWAWYLNAFPTSGSLIRSLFYAFMPRECIYTGVFYPPSSPQRRKPGYAALLRIRGNYFRPYLSIPRVCHRGAACRWKFSYNLRFSFAWVLRFTVVSIQSRFNTSRFDTSFFSLGVNSFTYLA